MTITRRIAFAVTGLVVLTVLAGAIGLGAQLWMKTWSSDYKDSAARVKEASRISAGSASMVTYGLADLFDRCSKALLSATQLSATDQAAAGTRQVEEEVQRLQDLAENLRRLVNAKATA